MVIGVLKEIKGNEYRVAAVPATVHELSLIHIYVLREDGPHVQQQPALGDAADDGLFPAAQSLLRLIGGCLLYTSRCV